MPLGTIVSGTPVPFIASETARTVPSPPATSTASAPSFSAWRVDVVAEVVDRRLVEERLAPPGLGGRAADRRAQGAASTLIGL